VGVVVSCAISWDLSVYSIRFWQSGRIANLVVVALLNIALVWLMKLSVRAKHHWWSIVPVLVALLVPVALQFMERGVQPNSRFLSDAKLPPN